MLVGIHIENINDDNLIEVKKYGGNCVQLFVDIMSKKIKQPEYQKKILLQNNIKCVVHASYTINCSLDWNEYSWWIKQFIEEIKYANKIGALGIVIHLGKQLNLTTHGALNNFYSALLYVNSETITCSTLILIETSTGQGSEICYKLEDLAYFYRKIISHKNSLVRNRIKLCVDTCHIFSAGYDITNLNTIEQYLDRFDELIGLENIKLIHLNDSANENGSHIDRHENLGNGKIGEKSLLYFAKKFIDLDVPVILETPIVGITKDLKKLVNVCNKK